VLCPVIKSAQSLYLHREENKTYDDACTIEWVKGVTSNSIEVTEVGRLVERVAARRWQACRERGFLAEKCCLLLCAGGY